MKNSTAQRQEESFAPEDAASNMESLLREYGESKPVLKELSLQLQIGEELGSMILKNQANAREILTRFTELAPTKFERVMQRKTTSLDATTRESVGTDPQLHIVRAQEHEVGDPAILVTNEHVRMSIYLRTIRELMTKLHEMPYSQYQQFRDEFNKNMYAEMNENDKNFKQMNPVQKKAERAPATEATTERQKIEDIGVLTFGHFTSRLENTIVNMATVKIATDSNQ